MLSLIIKVSIISIIFILLIHNLIHFFKNTLTVPKIKDLVNFPQQKYIDIQNIISSENYQIDILNENSSYSVIDLLPNINENKTNDLMKDELKSFLKDQLNSDTNEHNIVPYSG
jgi:hypothetical protein